MASPSYRTLLLDNPAYRLLWLGTVVSFLGDWFSTIALYTMVQQLTDSKLAVAGVFIAKTLPVFLMVPVAGPLVDRLERRGLMVFTDLARAVCVVGLIVAYQVESLALMFTSLVAMVSFSGLFIPARTASIPDLTRDDELPAAMALSGGTWSVMLAVGAALGGLVTGAIGVQGALVLDAGTFLLSAALLRGLPELPPADDDDTGSAGFVAGVRYMVSDLHVSLLGLCKMTMSLAAAGVVMLPVFGNGVFTATAGPTWIGVLYAARGLGALTGSMGIRTVTGDSPGVMRASLGPGFAIIAAGMALVAWSPSIGWTALGYYVGAVGSGIIYVYSGTLLQRTADPRFRGRLFSAEFGLMTLGLSIMSGIVGGLGDGLDWDARSLVWMSSALVLCAGLPMAGLVWWTARGRPEPAARPVEDDTVGA